MGAMTLGEHVGVRRNEADVAWDADLSPKGVYECHYREISKELTAVPRVLERRGQTAHQRPFEVDMVRIPPGRRLCPRHWHSVEWEYYIVVSGHGQMLQSSDEPPIPMESGDHLLQPPGWIHTIENDSVEDLCYYVIASNSVDETCYYPDSGKWSAAGKVFRMTEADYFDGEE